MGIGRPVTVANFYSTLRSLCEFRYFRYGTLFYTSSYWSSNTISEFAHLLLVIVSSKQTCSPKRDGDRCSSTRLDDPRNR